MPLKDLLISFSNGSSSDAVLGLGLALTSQAGAVASVIHVTPPVFEQSQVSTWMPDALMKQILEARRGAPERARKALEARLSKLSPGQALGWIGASGDIAETLAIEARTHDLLLIGRYSETTEELGARLRPEQIVTRSGRPLIVVPETWTRTVLRKAVIAWDGGPTAARALFDMMQLLPWIDEIHVVSVTTSGEPAILSSVKAYINRHGAKAHAEVLRQSGNVTSQILNYCDQVDADLLVVGSRGTTRLRSGLIPGGIGRRFSIRRLAPSLFRIENLPSLRQCPDLFAVTVGFGGRVGLTAAPHRDLRRLGPDIRHALPG